MTSDQHADNADRTTELLTQALADEAAGVSPAPGGLQRIQARIADPDRDPVRRRIRRRWLVMTPIGAGLAAAAVILGVVVLDGGGQGGGNNAAIQPRPHKGVYDPSAPASEQFTMWYVGPLSANPQAKPRLFAETHTVVDPGSDPALAAVQEFLTSTPIDPDYRSPWGDDAGVSNVSKSSGATVFDLRVPRSLFASTAQHQVAFQALARSAGLVAGDSFSINLNGDSDLAQYTVQPDDAMRAWLTIDNIVDGQTVSNPVTVQVSGNVFEGNVNWQLLDADGVKVDEGYTTTSQGMWTQVPVDLGTLAPGTYTFKVIEYSAEDGSIWNQDDKTFTVE
jgi:hypothetical protein